MYKQLMYDIRWRSVKRFNSNLLRESNSDIKLQHILLLNAVGWITNRLTGILLGSLVLLQCIALQFKNDVLFTFSAGRRDCLSSFVESD